MRTHNTHAHPPIQYQQTPPPKTTLTRPTSPTTTTPGGPTTQQTRQHAEPSQPSVRALWHARARVNALARARVPYVPVSWHARTQPASQPAESRASRASLQLVATPDGPLAPKSTTPLPTHHPSPHPTQTRARLPVCVCVLVATAKARRDQVKPPASQSNGRQRLERTHLTPDTLAQGYISISFASHLSAFIVCAIVSAISNTQKNRAHSPSRIQTRETPFLSVLCLFRRTQHTEHNETYTRTHEHTREKEINRKGKCTC